jgi:predicted aspartyl protease
MRYRSLWVLFFAFLICPLTVKSQSFDLDGNRKRTIIPFRTVRNMVIVTLNINDKGPFNFVLDTGVGIMLITDPKLVDSLNLPSKRTIKVYGVNGESYEAYVTPNLKIEMPNISSIGVSAAILKKDHFGLSNYAGMQIHGLLGYEFFRNLAVRFNFGDSTLTVSRPQYLKTMRKGTKIPLTIEDNKPYINTQIKLPEGKLLATKLLVDLGAGHPMLLDNLLKEEGGLPQNFIAANLGVGLTGPISGYISRVSELELGGYKLKNVLTSFPDLDYLKNILPTTARDGSIGIGVLRRFDLIIDYSGEAMYLKKSTGYSQPFEHDMTGMEYFFDGDDFTHLIIGRIEPGSAADNVDLLKDDEILSINFRPIEKMSLEQVDELFRSRNGRSLLLEIYRDKKHYNVILTLKKRI